MKKSLFALLIFLPLTTLAAATTTPQDHAAIQTAAEDFMREQTLTLPGQPEIKVGKVDKRLLLPECVKLEVFLPQGAQLMGNGMVGVRCQKQALAMAKPGTTQGWTLFLPVQVKMSVDLLIINKPLRQGQTLRVEDISVQSGGWLQNGMLTDTRQAVGKVLKYNLSAGQALRRDMLHEPFTVTQGSPVQLQIETAGLSIRSEGRALNNGIEGQLVQIRTASGRVVHGTARENGIVEVRP